MEGVDKEPIDGLNYTKDSIESELVSNEELIAESQEGMMDRLNAVERKVQQQADEILCLKSALADALRRLSNVEYSKQQPLIPKTPTMPYHAKVSPKKKPTINTVSRPNTVTKRPASTTEMSPRKTPSPTPKTNTKTQMNMRKWPSVPHSENTPNTVNGGLSNSSRCESLGSLALNSRVKQRGLREPTFNSDEKILRIYLKGRAVNMYIQSNVVDYNPSKPNPPPVEKLKLEWVYGYRGRDARNNLYLLPTGEMVYFVAAVVVLYNVDEQVQRHYLGHNDDVKCLSIHPDKITIASGQVAGHDKKEGKPHIRIWNSLSLQTLNVIGLGHFDRAVSCIGFSKCDNGQLLCAVDEANEHIMSVWNWQKETKITEIKSSTDPVLNCEFHPGDKNIIVSSGKGHISFWHFENNTLTKKQGIYEKHDKPRFVTSIAFLPSGDVLSGDSNGNLQIWGRGTNTISQVIQNAHDGAIFSITVQPDGFFLTGGGKDRAISKWDKTTLKKVASSLIDEIYGTIRIISIGKGSQIIIGTTKNCILIGSFDLQWSPIMHGHVEELWGLAAHPKQHQFVTAAHDKILYLWDALKFNIIWQKDLPEDAHCTCFHPDGNLVAIGFITGRWIVLDMNTQQMVSTHTDGAEQIECLSYSVDGAYLAVGSRDNMIYVYSVSDGGKKYTRVGRCIGHSSFITHIDWSIEGNYIQSNSGDYEILYWNGTNCKQISNASSLKDVEWVTHSCTLGFNVCGIWPEGADGTDINACCRAPRGQNLLASADDFGKINLFKYPCNQPRAHSHTFKGHSSHVTNVQFVHDDSRLISTGGKDTAILQWTVAS